MHSEPACIAKLDAAGKCFAGRAALAGIDLALHAGEMLAILGPNGAGKTTAIGLLTGRLSVDSGRASMFGADPRIADNRRRFGVMLQDTELPPTLRAIDLVRQFSAYYPQPRPVDETLALAGIAPFAHQTYGTLSGLWMPLFAFPAWVLAPIWPAWHLSQLALGVVGQAAVAQPWLHIGALLSFTTVFTTLAARRWQTL